MDKQTAMLALTFLERVQLNGKEVSAYARVLKALSAIVNPPPEPKGEPEEGEKTNPLAEAESTEGNGTHRPRNELGN